MSPATCLREQLVRIHENSTRMVGLTLANRSDQVEQKGDLSRELQELQELSRAARPCIYDML